MRNWWSERKGSSTCLRRLVLLCKSMNGFGEGRGQLLTAADDASTATEGRCDYRRWCVRLCTVLHFGSGKASAHEKHPKNKHKSDSNQGHAQSTSAITTACPSQHCQTQHLARHTASTLYLLVQNRRTCHPPPPDRLRARFLLCPLRPPPCFATPLPHP